MAKVMTLPDLKLSISRNGFDLSKKRLFSAKVGELTPVAVIPTLPKDKFKIDLSHFTRTEPLGAPAYTRINEYVDAYFVPYQLMWREAGYYLNSLDDQQQKASSLSSTVSPFTKMPWFALSDFVKLMKTWSDDDSDNQFGFRCAPLSYKLASYLGYPVKSWFDGAGVVKDWNSNPAFDQELSPFPACAYQKVYQDHFRFDVWEKTSPFVWDLSWLTPTSVKLNLSELNSQANNCLFTMRYVNNERDLFFGVYPDSQLGDEAVVQLGESTLAAPSEYTQQYFLRSSIGVDLTGNAVFRSKDAAHQGIGDSSKLASLHLTVPQMIALRNSLGLQSDFQHQFGILQLRMAETLQRYREVIQTGDQDIKSRLKRVWDAEVPAYFSDLSYRVGGYKSEIAINPVTNTNLEGADSSATIQATAASTNNSGHITFDASNYGNLPGIFIITYYARPLLEYSQNRAQLATTLVTREDFANPAFDRLGMEQIHLLDMVNTPEIYSAVQGVPVENLFIGYAPRYIKWKTDVDDIVGKFNTPSYSPWSASVTDAYIRNWIKVQGSSPNRYLVYDYNIFKVNPSYVNSLFKAQADASVNTDTFLINFAYDCQAVRSLDYNGMPY